LLAQWKQDLTDFPAKAKALTANLSAAQVQQTYRPNGWTICQVVHHCADSHMNAYIRFKLALTEDTPTIQPYFEDRWAKLSDGNSSDLTDSLHLLTALHKKWVNVIDAMTQQELKRSYIHPEHNKTFPLQEVIGLYAWHCNHHLAHIQLALNL